MKVGMLLPGVPWSGNTRKRKHHMAVYRHDAEWKHAVAWRAKAIRIDRTVFPAPMARVTVTFRFRTERRRDVDNWTAACKGILDGLVGPLIVDDDTKHMQLVVLTEVDTFAGTGETLVEVEPID